MTGDRSVSIDFKQRVRDPGPAPVYQLPAQQLPLSLLRSDRPGAGRGPCTSITSCQLLPAGTTSEDNLLAACRQYNLGKAARELR